MNLRSLFPNASPSFFEANASLQPAKSKPKPKKALERPAKGKEKSVGLISVRVRFCRVRRQDPDSADASAKNVVDALVVSGLIPDDSPDHITLIVEQDMVASISEEQTVIEVEWPD